MGTPVPAPEPPGAACAGIERAAGRRTAGAFARRTLDGARHVRAGDPSAIERSAAESRRTSAISPLESGPALQAFVNLMRDLIAKHGLFDGPDLEPAARAPVRASARAPAKAPVRARRDA